jgi:hypothetical protein
VIDMHYGGDWHTDDSSEYPKPGMYDADTGAGSHLLVFFMGCLSGLVVGVVIGWLL